MRARWRWVLLGVCAASLAGFTFSAPAAGAAQEPDSPIWDNQYCLGCHGSPGLELILPSGEHLDLTVPAEVYEGSVHGKVDMACALCHTGITEYPHRPIAAPTARQFTLQNYTACATCHDSEYTATHDNVHAQALTGGNPQAAVCTDCHGAHDVQKPGTRATAIQQTCENCHFQIYSLYAESVHGAALFEENNADVPTCTDCHGVHNLAGPAADSPFHLFSPQICAKCHEDKELMDEYGISTEVFDTYVADFHGTTVVIFEELFPDQQTNKPVCIDCHGVHNIASADDPNSQTFRENLLGTCQRCHPDATTSFPTAWLSHYSPTPQDAPLVFYVNLFYRIIIPLIIGAMLMWVIFDLAKRAAARRRETRHA